MEKPHQNLKNRLEKISGLEGIFGIFAYEGDEKIYSKCSSEKAWRNAENANAEFNELCSNLDSIIKELKLSLRDCTIQFSENFKIILLNKKENEHNYRFCFLTSRYMDTISIRRYID